MGQSVNHDLKKTEDKVIEYIENSMLEQQVIAALLNVVQDGICLVSPDLDIIYSNPAMHLLYELKGFEGKKKCYEVYHGRRSPCDNCPILKTIETGALESAEQPYEKGHRKEGRQRIYSVPVKDEKGTVVFAIEYVRDITRVAKAELSVELMTDSIRNMTEQLKKQEKAYREREEQIVASVNKTIRVVLNYLQKTLDDETYEVVKSTLEMSPTGVNNRPALSADLSGTELMIARYIADGYLSKEIAEELQISKKTVDYHRTNLRKKLGLGPEDNLKREIQRFFIENGI